jgi:hypothetical protein
VNKSREEAEMTNIVIHYSGPTDDVPTVPRPTRINLATRAVANAGATAGLQFLGIHPDRNDPTAASGYVDWFEIDTDSLDGYAGWFAAFEDGANVPFTVDTAIERIDTEV